MIEMGVGAVRMSRWENESWGGARRHALPLVIPRPPCFLFYVCVREIEGEAVDFFRREFSVRGAAAAR